MSVPNSAGGPSSKLPTHKAPTSKGPTIRSNPLNPLYPSKDPRTPSTSSTPSGAPPVRVMVPEAFAQDAKNQFLVSQGLQNQRQQDQNSLIGGWVLNANFNDNFRPVPATNNPVPYKEPSEVFVEVIYCGESNLIPEQAWEKHLK